MPSWRLARLVSTAVVAVSLGGCARTLPALTCPERGGARWNELTSAHFVVHTDLAPAAARAATHELEAMYGALTDLVYRRIEDRSDSVDVVIFAREADYQEAVSTPSDGFFKVGLAHDPDPRPTIGTYGRLDGPMRQTIQHELSHRLLRRSIVRPPAWMNEGAAQLYSTLRLENGVAYLGERLPDLRVTFGSTWEWKKHQGFTEVIVPLDALPPLRELVSTTPSDFYGGSEPSQASATRTSTVNYAASWALVHLFTFGPAPYPDRYAAFVTALERGAFPKAAFEEAFRDLPFATIERDLRAHLRAGAPARELAYTPTSVVVEVRERAMSDAEIHLLWARIRDWEGNSGVAARRDLAEAQRRDPTSLEVRYWRGLFYLSAGPRNLAEAELTAAVKGKPDDPRYLTALGKWYQEQDSDLPESERNPERLAALIARLSKVARTPRQLVFIAAHHVRRDDSKAALPFARRAVEADSQCWQCFATYAVALSQTGDHARAEAMVEQAWAAVPEHPKGVAILEELRGLVKKAREDAATEAKEAPP